MRANRTPVTAGVLKPKMGGAKDAWVALVGAAGDRLDFLTYFGPSDDTKRHADETLRAVALANDGNLWLAGTTQGSDLAPTPGAFQPERGGDADAFVAKITPDGKDHLAEKEEEIDDLLGRLEAVGGDQRKAEGPPIKRAVGNLLSSIWHRVTRDDMDEATMHKIAAILDEAAQKIERLP